MPPLTEERRKELIKVVKHEAENARVAVRNLRRDAIHQLKDALKKHEVSENDERRALDEMQKMTDRHIADIDRLLAGQGKGAARGMSETPTSRAPPARSRSAGDLPRHVAIIMDGNGRWAQRRRLPRIAGHRRGAEAVRATVRACAERGIEYLTLFAFSSENWRRPAEEVALLMKLFKSALENEVEKLHANGVRLKVVGDTQRFDPKIRKLIERAEALTAHNRRLTLTIAANYGGAGTSCRP